MDLTKIEQINSNEDANLVLLLLYREYSKKMLADNSNKDECTAKMQQIKQDLRLPEEELICKTKNIYLPLLKLIKNNFE